METNIPAGTVLLNVCILPTTSVADECISLASSLESDATIFVLDGKKAFPHMTVYMGRFPESAIAEVLQAAKTAIETNAAVFCEQSGYFLTAGRYVEVSYKKTPELMTLHERLLDALKPFRYSPGSPIEESYFAPYIADQQNNAEATGYDLAYDLYRPHITLARYKEGQAPAVVPEFPSTELSFTPSEIALYKADDNGAVYELIENFTPALSN
jgi:2'-5' RNA ligase